MVFRSTMEPGFTGLTLEQTGYESWDAMADAVEESNWKKQPGTADWVVFPETDRETGAFHQRRAFDARSLAYAFTAAGDQLGFEKNRWGVWVLRKNGCAALTEA